MSDDDSAVNRPCDQSSKQDEGFRPRKKPKFPQTEDVHLRNLPSCETYEKSYMHRDVVTHICMSKTQFLTTVSVDGFIKFWKKTSNGIDFVKSFKSHTGPIEDISITSTGSELASISRIDRSVKIFDIVNFDMINMFSLDFEPRCVEWTQKAATGNDEDLIISDNSSPKIYTFNARQSTSKPRNTISTIHSSIVCRMRMNPIFNIIVSIDIKGVVKYWRTKNSSYHCIKHPNASPEIDSVIQEFVAKANDDPNKKLTLHNISFSPDGHSFATTSSDRKIRVFKFKTGKLVREYNESLQNIETVQKNQQIMDSMTFARRMAIERELDKNLTTRQENAIFDQSGQFILFPTFMGVKVWNWKTNELVKIIGRDETNFRPLSMTLFQGLICEKVVRRINSETLGSSLSDPTLFCTSYKKNRFYCFSNRYFEEDVTEGEGGEFIKDRDIYNEKPTREEMMAAVELQQ